MDYYIRVTVAVALSIHIVTGRSYVPFDRHTDFYHDYEHLQPKQWQDGQSSWHQDSPTASKQRPAYYQREHKHLNPHKNPHFDKEFWISHHTSDSWEYPDFPVHGDSGSWGNLGWDNNKKPNYWPQRPGSSWNNGNPAIWGAVTPTSTTSAATDGSRDTLTILLCIRACPVTSEYNPVCGSNNVTYGNPSRLECAKYCGVYVTVKRNSACPAPDLNNMTTQNQTTVTPSQPDRQTLKPISPTRFTTVEVPPSEPAGQTSQPTPGEPNPPFTISPDILNSIFTPSTTTENDNFDIDIRTRNRQSADIEPFVFPI